MSLRDEMLTAREVRKRYGVKLEVHDFINSRGLLPLTEIPSHLIGKSQASRAEAALQLCEEISGSIVVDQRKFDDPDFIYGDEEFTKATGVTAKEVLKEITHFTISNMDSSF